MNITSHIGRDIFQTVVSLLQFHGYISPSEATGYLTAVSTLCETLDRHQENIFQHLGLIAQTVDERSQLADANEVKWQIESLYNNTSWRPTTTRFVQSEAGRNLLIELITKQIMFK